MATPVMDPVRAGVIFDRGSVRPAWFEWAGRRHTVKQVTMRWQTRQGRVRLLHLGVTDGAGLFELIFDPEMLVWSLARVEATDA